MPRVFKDGHSFFGFGGKASDAVYDNTNSGLQATNVQSAIDENASGISTLNSRIGGISMVVLGPDDFTINGEIISFKNATYASKVVGAHIVTTNGYLVTGIRSINGIKRLRAVQPNETGATILSSLSMVVSVLVFLQD